ncbi:MAG: hypothetical protein BroJett029_20180 [Alphaproteobacteria bacterium]|nr:MAG: hypothetical protein BroJett029_20180 [Alphaproteobacteria bacterium]
MVCLAGVVVPNLPHDVTQRGNGRARTFFSDDDHAFLRDLLATQCTRTNRSAGLVPDPNPVRLVSVPPDAITCAARSQPVECTVTVIPEGVRP